ncbi:MAG: OmpA family protein [Pseudomonadota bacterium]
MRLRWIFSCALVVALAVASGPAAIAQDTVNSNSIVDALKPKKKPLTRSLTAPPGGIKRADSQFINGLRGSTRGIRFEERKQLATIVKDYELASIDLEINFDYDSDRISARAKPALVQLGIALRDDGFKDAVFLVSGHTDASGTDAYNLDLSERRARSIVGFLESTFSIEKSQLIAVGYGEEQLKKPDQPEAAENRRVTIVNMTK